MNRTRHAIGAVAALLAASTVAAPAANALGQRRAGLRGIDHIVVIYEENHSFDNLYGLWEGVNGLSKATPARTTQVNVAGTPYACLLQNDVNLVSPTPLSPTCADASSGTPGGPFASAFANAPFNIDTYISAADLTCPPALKAFSFPNGVVNGAAGAEPGGCTRDMVHKFYQEQYQIDGGKQDRYVTGSDAVGLTMGYYDSTKLPIYQYLHGDDAPNYVIADNFFQGAFGGSFLNHQWLIAARTPVMANAPAALHAVLGPDGHPRAYPLHPASGTVDGVLTVAPQADGSCAVPAGLPQLCGDYAVNTMVPPYVPTASFAPALSPQSYDTIGDRLTGAGVDWGWYAGGWDNATGNATGRGWTNGSGPACSDPETAVGTVFPLCPNNVFQYHHQPFNYFTNYAPGTPGRSHLQDEAAFVAAAKAGKLKPVSFVKPLGQDNEHPGYASEPNGSNHLVDLIKAVMKGKDAEHTMIVVTYDEFGGQWDHVSPPTGAGVSDAFGPGTRVPALVISPELDRHFAVDHTSHDTTSILATIEHRFGLAPLSTRDASVADLGSVFRAGERERGKDR